MGKKKKLKKLTFLEIIRGTRNIIHYAHITKNIKPGLMGPHGKRKKKKDRKKTKQECRIEEQNG
jgi:hypothetical protein